MSKKVITVGTKFRPSNSDRYLNCPASVVMAKDIPLDDGTVYSNTGNVAHALAELCIEQNIEPASKLGEQILPDMPEVVTEDMVADIQGYLDWINSQGFSKVEVEKDVSLPWVPNGDGSVTTGKADLVGYNEDFNVLMVVDYKNGVMPVPDDSFQFACYAYPLLFDEESPYKHLDEVTTVRYQPNVMDGTRIGYHTWKRGELIRLKAKIEYHVKWVAETKAKQIQDKDYNEGSHCKFCPNSHQCPVKAKALFDNVEPEEILPAPSTLTSDKIRLILDKRADIKKWLDDVYKFHLAQGINGNPVEGMKVVEGRTKPRAWRKSVTEEEIKIQLSDAGLKGDQWYQAQKLITPSTAKKLLKGTEKIEDLLDPVEKSLELVPCEDSRDSIDGTDLFADESDAETNVSINA